MKLRQRVEVVLIDRANKVFGGVYPDGTFALPGGGTEGKDFLLAAQKELLEETGYEADEFRLLSEPSQVSRWYFDHVLREDPEFRGSSTRWVAANVKFKRGERHLDYWGASSQKFYSFEEAMALLERGGSRPEMVEARRRAICEALSR